MFDYEDKILERQELQEISEENYDTQDELFIDFPIEPDNWNAADQLVAEVERYDISWKAKVNELDRELSVNQFIGLVNYGGHVFKGFKNLTEVLAYLMYLEDSVVDYERRFDELKLLNEKLNSIIR